MNTQRRDILLVELYEVLKVKDLSLELSVNGIYIPSMDKLITVYNTSGEDLIPRFVVGVNVVTINELEKMISDNCSKQTEDDGFVIL